MNSIVVHYKELALKGRNRPWFVQMLVRNLKVALTGLDIVSIRSIMGRIEIELGSGASWSEARDRVRHVFGIANFSYAGRGSHDFDSLAGAILHDVGDRHPQSFRVRAKRSDKRFAFTSPQVEREVGGRIKDRTGWRVDLEDAELSIYIEVLPDQAFYFFGKEPGAGGLPTGTGGRVACLLSGGIDSPVAAYRMMRRGCSVLLVHFHSYPILSRASQEKVREIAALLTRYQLRSRLVLVPFGELQQQVVLGAAPELRVVIYRRLMLRIAERLARRWHARALVTGEVIGQVASQTLENLTTIVSRDRLRGTEAARRDGQGRDHGRGRAHRHAAHLEHPGSGLLPAVYAAPSGDPRAYARTSKPPKPLCRSARWWRPRLAPRRLRISGSRCC